MLQINIRDTSRVYHKAVSLFLIHKLEMCLSLELLLNTRNSLGPLHITMFSQNFIEVSRLPLVLF